MKQKLLAVFLVLCIGTSFCACGTSSPEAEQNDVFSSDESIQNEENYVDDVSKDFAEDLTDEQEEIDDEGEITNDEPSGLIILTVDESLHHQAITNINIASLDPKNGNQQIIASFTIKSSREYGYGIPNISNKQDWYASHKQWVSNDCVKVAVTKYIGINAETHAGWLENDGNFFDVTEKLGLESKGDFDDPVEYISVGFTEDDYFVYYDNNKNSYYYIPISNVSRGSIVKGNPFPHSDEDLYSKYKVTDWIDNNTLIRNEEGSYHKYSSVIENIETGETLKYIPDSSRDNWNGVLSPDGSTIAFMSKTVQGTGISIFTIPVSGGDPVKVESNIDLSWPEDCENNNAYQCANNRCTTLIDWH